MRILFCADYWNGPLLNLFRPIAQTVQSRFFTMDVAQKRDGTWIIVELGDGQVAGLPARADVEVIYQTLIATFEPMSKNRVVEGKKAQFLIAKRISATFYVINVF